MNGRELERIAREELLVPTDELAKKCELTPKTLRNLFEDRHSAQVKNAKKICEVLVGYGATESQLRRIGLIDVYRALGHADRRAQELPSNLRTGLVGRRPDLLGLTAAWEGMTSVYVLHGRGGEGKTALVDYWLKNDWNAAGGDLEPFVWSFWNQGGREHISSLVPFLEAALSQFGDADPKRGIPREKAERLIVQIRAQRRLIVLDGLEAHQQPLPDDPDVAYISDPDLKSLLREIAAENPGLCIVTTRYRIGDLVGYHRAKHRPVKRLGHKEGASLLRKLGTRGAGPELERASEEYDGHALSLLLLGTFLKYVHQGDIRARDQIIGAAGKSGSEPASRMLSTYEAWYRKSRGLETIVLRLLSAFDRPVERVLLDVLTNADLTLKSAHGPRVALKGVDAVEWSRAVGALRIHGLVRAPDDSGWSLDCHPLVREHFRKRFCEEDPRGWKALNEVLFERFRTALGGRLPESQPEMDPLIRAVRHGCNCGRFAEAFEIYLVQIQRHQKSYLRNMIGGFGANLHAIAGFFRQPWSEVVDALGPEARMTLLNDAAYCLEAIGRIHAAMLCLKRASVEVKQSKRWADSKARSIYFLARIMLQTGRLEEAVAYAREAVDHAECFEAEERRCCREGCLALYGACLAALGERSQAEAVFEEVSKSPARCWPTFPLFEAVTRLRYAEHLLDRGDYSAIVESPLQFFPEPKRGDVPLLSGYRNFALGKALALKVEREADLLAAAEKKSLLGESHDHFARCSSIMQRTDRYTRRPEVYVAWAGIHRLRGNGTEAEECLKLAREQCIVSSPHREDYLYLPLLDCVIEEARCALSRGDADACRRLLREARAYSRRIGHGRRESEIRSLREQLRGNA